MPDVRLKADLRFYHLITTEFGGNFYSDHCCCLLQGECGKEIMAGVDMHDRRGGDLNMGFKSG